MNSLRKISFPTWGLVATELALHEAQTLFEQKIDLLLAGLAPTGLYPILYPLNAMAVTGSCRMSPSRLT